MSEQLAYKYAKALFEISEKKHKLLKILTEIKILTEVFKGNILDFFLNPKIDKTEKKYIITQALEKYDFTSELLYFVYILINKNRLKIFPLIYNNFLEIKDKREFLIRAKITTTNLMSEEIVSEIINTLNNSLKRKIDWEQIKDNSILGGFKVKIGDKLFDASIKNSLEKIHDKMLN